MCLSVHTIQGPPGEKKKGKRNRKRKGSIQKDWIRNSLATNRYKIPNGGQKRTLVGGPKERKACQKAMMVSRRVVVRLNQPDKGAGKDFHQNKGRGKDQRQRRHFSSFRIVIFRNTQ